MTSWKRKEVIGDCTLFQADCRDILPFIERSYAVVTDPPYGIKQANGMGRGGTDASGRYKRKPKKYVGSWDNERPSADTFGEVIASADRHIIWGGNYFADLLPTSGRWLFWDKLNSMPSYSDGEMAWTSLDGDAVKKFTYCNNGLASKRDGERHHPTQKPVALMAWCLSLLPVVGGRILDPFMGSGSTGVACVARGFPFVGIELNSDYFDIACQRISEAYLQADMFVPPKLAPLPSAQDDMFAKGGAE